MSADIQGKIVPPTPEAIAWAAEILRGGGLVAFPTETVYGLGANALSAEAVRKIFLAKGRPGDNPLIVHVASIPEVETYARVTPLAETLMRRFWPGPLTIVLESRPVVPALTRAGLATVGVRMPSHPVALALIRAAGVPLAAPSANRSGRPSPTTARTVLDDLGERVDLILDGGEPEVGLESTVVDATGGSAKGSAKNAAAILRPGGVTREMLTQVADVTADPRGELAARSPGTRHRHYAPAVPLLLWEGGVFPEILSGRRWSYAGMSEPPRGAGEPREKMLFATVDAYGHGLFKALRALESGGADVIVAELPPEAGLGLALRDRLRRAAGAV